MKFIIAGAGHIGSYIAKYLSKEDHDITLIDKNADLIKNITDNESIAGFVGDITSIRDLQDANIANTDVFIAATNNDEANIVACKLADYFKVQSKIIRLQKEHYLASKWQEIIRGELFYIDEEILIGKNIIESIKRIIDYNHLGFSDIVELAEGDIKIFSTLCTKEMSIIGKSLEEIEGSCNNNDLTYPCYVIGALKVSDFKISKRTVIEENDKIFFIAKSNDMKTLYYLLYAKESYDSDFLESRKPNVVISGDSKFLEYIAVAISEEKIKVKVISSNNDNKFNEALSESLGKHNIPLILDDISDSFYRNNYIKSESDIIILMHLEDKENIFKSLLLKNDNFQQIICILKEKVHYQDLLLKNGIYHIISPNEFIMPSILNHIRRGLILNSFSLYEKVEILELEVSDIISLVGKRISDIEIQNKIKVLALFDEKDNLIKFNEDSIIQVGYNIIVMVDRKFIKELEDILIQN